MKRSIRYGAIVVLLLAGLWALSLGRGGADAHASTEATGGSGVEASIPRLVCLGAGKCIPCKQMEPVREALREEFDGRLAIEYHDVWKDGDIGRRFGIRVIPTSVFFDAEGNELYRQEGFMSKEEILNRWKQLGIELDPASAIPE